MGMAVPAGATVTFVASGTVEPRPYFAGYWVAQYWLNLNLWANGAVVYNTRGDVDYYDTNLPSTIQFSNRGVGSWKNNTGSDVTIGMDMWASPALGGSGIQWSLSAQISGATGGSCVPLVRSELFGPNQALGQQCPSCHGGTDYSVDSLTGNEHWVLPGVKLDARGPGIDLELAYNSLAAGADDSIGHGWRDSYDMSLSPGAFGTEVVTQETGATVPFVQVGSGSSATWVAPSKFDATLVHNADGSWLFTRHHRELFSFDSNGRLVSIADRNGYTTTLSYGTDGLDHVVDDAGHRLDFAWANGRVQSITDVSDPGSPRALTFGYDAAGDLTRFGDIGGGAWPMSYDDSHRLVSVQSPRLAGGTAARQFHYDSQGRVDWEEDPQGGRTNLYYDDPQPGATRVVDPAGNARVDYYNDAGQRTSVTTGYGTAGASTTQFVYDPSTWMVTDRTDGRGKHWQSVYGDPANPFSPTKTTDPVGRVRTMIYTADGDPTSVTDAHGITTAYAYDGNGNPTSMTAASGTATAGTVKYVYGDSAHPGEPTSILDARGHTWALGHDPTTGELTRLTDPKGNVTTWSYNPEGWMVSKVAPAGNVAGGNPASYTTSYTYNAYGQPATVTNPLGQVSRTRYDADGNVVATTDATGDETDYTWTLAGQLASVTRGAGTASAQTLTYTYWPDGQVKTWSTRPGAVWSLDWDALGRATRLTDPNGNATSYGYDPDGRPTSTTVAAGTSDATTTTTSYDADGRKISVTQGAGSPAAVTTSTTYDIAAGTTPCQGGPDTTRYCISSTTAGRQTVRFYNARDQLVKVSRPGAKSVSYRYDPAGSVTSSTDASGTVTSYSYDADGQLTHSGNGAAADEVSFGYDANGQRASMTDATGTTSYKYDRSGRLVSVTDGSANKVSYALDPTGRVRSLTYPDGRVVSYTYNAAGQMTSLTDGAGGQRTNFGYDAEGTLTSTSLPNGDTISTPVDAADQPTAASLANASGSTLAGVSYDYDHAGRIATAAGDGAFTGSATNGYDTLNRLTASTDSATNATTSYGYDQAGNPTTLGAASQTFNTAGQLQTSTTGGTATSFDYDANGNRTRGSPSTGTGYSYRYDPANRLVAATTPDPNPTGSQYHPLPITRLVDTRNQTGSCSPAPCTTVPAGGSLTVQVSGQGGVPTSGVKAVVLNVTTLNNTGNGRLVAYPTGDSPPTGRSLSITSGAAQSSAVVTGLSAGGKVTFFSSTSTDLLIEVSGWYANPTDQTGSVFNPIDGTRILDTRDGTGSCTPSPCARLAAGATSTVQLGGQGGVPATGVTAVVFTLSAFNPDRDGLAVAWPADQSRPTPRNLSYQASTDASELVVVKPSAQGQIKLFSSGAADYTIDLAGYYTTSNDGTGNIFVPYDPATGIDQRILDTRTGTGTCTPTGCPTLQPDKPATVTVAGHGGIPTDATAVVLSATAWKPTGDGRLLLWPADQDQPPGRNLSYSTGVTTSATAQLALSAQGQIKAGAFANATDLSLDVEGWFEPAGVTTKYSYSGDGLRTTKTTPDGHATHYTYNPATPVPELLTDGKTDYLYGPTGAPLESTAAAGGTGPTSYYLTDATGSTRALTGATGTVTGTYSYTPYGTVANHTGTDTPLQYAGGYTDPETGLDYLINRYYDPTTGQFTTTDPLQNLTNQPYTYADDNPINETDPTGQCPWCIAMAVGALVGGGSDLATQMLNNVVAGCPALYDISWGEVATSAALGAGLEGLGIWATGLRSTQAATAEIGQAAESAGAAERTVVMGRNMGGRVIPYAEKNGFDYYKGTPSWVPRGLQRVAPKTLNRVDMWFNKRWINNEMRGGSRIIDIGEPPGMPPSDFYNMELDQVDGYWNYFQDFQP
jgi:RHS repeat-associated protein